MSEVSNETQPIWAQDTLANADVVAAHEKTMFLHRVALLGAITVKNHLEGQETRGDTMPVAWGRIHSLGPICSWTDVYWKSKPVYIGENEQNDLGLSHEYMTLSMRGKIETTRDWSGSADTLMDDNYTLTRHLGVKKTMPTEMIKDPNNKSVHLDRNYTCRDLRDHTLWSPEDQIRDYESRVNDITEFMDELSALVSVFGEESKLRFALKTDHVGVQLKKIADTPNRNMRYPSFKKLG